MNRLYTLLYMAALATTVLAQTTTEAPNQHLHQLEENLQELGYKVGYHESNIDAYKISHNWFVDMSLQQGRERLEKAIDDIRVAFTEVSKEATESQQYEYHKNGTDTIEYALGFMSPEFKDSPSIKDSRLNFIMNAYEYANFFYRKNVEGRDVSTYMHTH